MQFGFYEMIRPKVDLWRSFEGQQGARLTEKEKKTDFTANSAGEFSASFFFFFHLCRELYFFSSPFSDDIVTLKHLGCFDYIVEHRYKMAHTHIDCRDFVF